MPLGQTPSRTNWAVFHDAAVWVDGPQGVRHGADAIKSELANQLIAVGGVSGEVKTLISEGTTIMVEQVSKSSVRGHPISAVVMAVFEFALKSMMDQIKAAAG